MNLLKVNSKSSIYARLLFSVLVWCLLVTFGSCSEEDAPAEIIPNPDSEIYFTKSLDFTSGSGEAIFSFTTNKNWSIDVSQSGGDVSWCTVFPNQGKTGENQVSVRVQRNESTDDRNVVLNLTAGDLTKSIVVTQKQKDAITLTTAKFEVDSNGGDIQVEVKANVSYDVVIPEQYQSWVREGSGSVMIDAKGQRNNQTYTTRADMDKTTRWFHISPSEEYDKREGEIIFRSGELEETLKIYQAGGGILLLSKNEYTVSDKGDQIKVEINSNFDFEVKMPQVDWITTNVTRSVSSHTLYYTVAPNTTYDKREAEIIYYDRSDKSVADTLKIVQVQKDAILLSQKEYLVGCNEEYIEVDVNTNVDFEIQIQNSCASWITKVDNPVTKGLVSHKLRFKISENTSYDERSGEIVIKDKKGGLSETVIIKQAERKVVILPIHKYDIGYKGGMIKIEISSNIPYTYAISANCDWVAKTENFVSRGLSTDLLCFMVYPNEAFESRETEIIFYSENNKVKEERIIIMQKGVPFQMIDNTLMVNLGVSSDKLLLKQLCLDNDIVLSKVEKICLYGELSNSDYDFLNVLSSTYNLSHIDLSNSLITMIPGYAFQGCTNLEIIEFPAGLISIWHYAFYGCNNLKNIVLPDGLGQLMTGTFRECYSLEKITIPSSVNSIASQCFYLTGVNEVHCKGNTPPQLDRNAFGGKYDKIKVYVPKGAKLAYQLAGGWSLFKNIIEE